MADDWSTRSAEFLERTDLCPRCGSGVVGPRCATCGADLTSVEALDVLRVSVEAAGLLRRRASLIDALPTASLPDPAAVGASMPSLVDEPSSRSAVADAGMLVSSAAASVPAAESMSAAVAPGSVSDPGLALASAPPPAPQSSITLQSVMAVAGAGLVAVAAIVFSYVNPDFTDVGARALVLLAVTVLMIGGAAALIRLGLRFSAEAIGALGGVLVALDIQSVAEYTGVDVSPWTLGAIGCIVGAALLAGLGILVRLRAWIWYAAAGITLAPALFGYAGGEPSPTLGHLAAIAVSLLAQPVLARLTTRMGSRLTAARVTSTVLRLVATAVLLVEISIAVYPFAGPGATLFRAGIVLALAVATALGALVQLRRFGAAVAGVLAVTAVVVAVAAVPLPDPIWWWAAMPAGAAVAAVVLAAIRVPGGLPRAWLVGGAVAALAAVGSPLLVLLLRILGAVVALASGRTDAPELSEETGLALRFPVGSSIVAGLVALALASIVLWRLTRRRSDTRRLARWILGTGLWIAPLLGLALLVAPELPIDVAVLLAVTPALGSALLLLFSSHVRAAPVHFRIPFAVTAHLLPVVVAPIAVQRGPFGVPLAAAVLLTWVLVALTAPRRARVLHAVAGHVYALVALGAALSAAGLGVEVAGPVVALVSAAAGIVLTRLRRIPADLWLGAMIVGAVPFVGLIAQVLLVRTGWTAGAAFAGAVLAAVVVASRRPGLHVVVRTIAAALIVPSVAVAVVCLGAQVLEVSASPVVLPVVAALVALALPASGGAIRMLERLGVPADEGRPARLAIEASALVTGAVAVLLALVRVAAGPETAFAVLVIVGLGSVATGLFARRLYAWIVAFWSFSGALWTFLGLVGVAVPEAYALPPALSAALIAAILVARRRLVAPARALFGVALAVAPLPSLGVVLLSAGDRPGEVVPRVVALLAGAVVLLVLAALVHRIPGDARLAALRPLGTALAGVVVLAAAAGPVEGVRIGWWLDATALGRVPEAIWPALGVSASGAVVAALAGGLLARIRPPRTDSGAVGRWVLLPALAFLVAGPIASTHRGWAPIWLLWTLALLLLALMVATAARASRHPTVLPPVGALFAIAWVTAVAGWSMRDLRVEVFSLPLGLALLAVGVIGMRAQPTAALRVATLASWPHGFAGSWRLLAPGIVVTLLPSMLATGTDPQTWRAITVLALALTSILVGSLRKLAAPFLLGIAVLPIENVIVFGAQLGRSISATSWWISLATAGAVLLVIAVTSERRSGGGIAARLRDLR